jgi:anti-sigma factor RsiW
MKQQSQHITGETLQDFLAGRLGIDESAAFQQHLAVCEDCSKRVRVYRQVEQSIRQLPVEHASDMLREQILEEVGVTTQQAYKVAGLMAGFLAALFVGAMLLLIFALLGIVPIHSSIVDVSSLNAWWSDTSAYLTSAMRRTTQWLGLDTIGISSMAVAGLSAGVIVVLLALDRLFEWQMVRGGGAR